MNALYIQGIEILMVDCTNRLRKIVPENDHSIFYRNRVLAFFVNSVKKT